MAYVESRVEAAGEDEPFALTRFLPFRLARAAQTVSDLVAATCEQRFGLTMAAWRMLCALAEGGPLEIRDLAYRTALEEACAREATAALLVRGLVVRAQSEGRFEVTPTGLAAHHELAGLALAAQAALLSGLSPAEVASLHRLLGRVEGAADKLAGR